MHKNNENGAYFIWDAQRSGTQTYAYIEKCVRAVWDESTADAIMAEVDMALEGKQLGDNCDTGNYVGQGYQVGNILMTNANNVAKYKANTTV